MCVWMYVCLYICVYVFLYVCMYVNVCIYVCMCIYVCIYTRVYWCMYVFICVCMYIRMYISMNVCKYVWLNTYIHICKFVCKTKSVPLQAWTVKQYSRRLRSPDFLTIAHECGRLSALGTGRLYFYPDTHFYRLSRPQGTWDFQMPRENPCDTGIRSRYLPTCSAVP